MADVAREAGVSLMTVSRALNHKDGISEETRDRIQAVVEKLGYRPSGIARGLVTKRTGTLGLVVPDNSNPYFSEVARGVEHAAYASGYNVFLCNTEEDPQRERIVIQSLMEKQVDGLIVCSPRLLDDDLRVLLNYFPAIVLINRVINDYPSSIRTDDENGGRLAVKHLMSIGRCEIGMLAGPERSFSGWLRQTGYVAALQEAAIAYDPGWIQPCLPMVDASYIAALELLKRHSELTALFCFNDLVAFGALQACAQLGKRVPDDIAIIGYDDIPLASLVTPALTTVHVPRYEIGWRAGEMLLDQIRGEATQTLTVLPVELAVRASAPHCAER